MLDETDASQAAWRPGGTVPGPVDRVSFFDEQQRRRRSTWQLSAVCAVTVIALGLAVSIVVVPLLVIQSLVLLHLLDIFLPIPHAIYWPLDAYGEVLQHTGEAGQTRLQTALGIAVLVAPGVVFLLLIWLWLRRLFQRAGIGGVLLTLGAREPRLGDLEERQLVNVVEEMAIAGGIGRPRIMLLDAGPPNAAAFGSGPDQATVIVSRRLLDEFDRDETQGTLAHLIAGIGNGDLSVALTIMSVVQSFGLLLMLINAPISPTARATLRRLVRLWLRGRSGDAEADLITTMLASSYQSTMDELVAFGERAGDSSRPLYYRIPRWIVICIFFPLILTSIFGGLVIAMVEFFVLGPLLALIWRSRCYLADATAVQLTRNPDSLARGLRHLARDGGVLPAGRQVSHLFVVGPEVAEVRAQGRLAQRLASLRRTGGGRPSRDQMWEAVSTVLEAQRDYAETMSDEQRGTFEEQQGLFISMHPPLRKRIDRLLEMGASVGDADLSLGRG